MADTTPGPGDKEVPSLDPTEQESTVPARPVNLQAKKVLDEALQMVLDGSLSLVFLVGVGPHASFSRNIGGNGNAYELAGLVELQKKELLDAIPNPPPAQTPVQPDNTPGC